MRSLWWNVRWAVRSWSHAPLLALTAIGTLALGIGVTSAVYSVANGVLFNVVPYSDSARIVALQPLRLRQSSDPQAATPATFLDWREQATAFEGLAATQYAITNLTDGEDEGVMVEGARVSANALELFEVRPLLGRAFTEADAAPGAEPVAILSQGLWQRRYAADPNLVGGNIEIDGQPVRVVGVLRSEQFFPGPWTEVLRPLPILAGQASRTDRTLNVVGLLRSADALPQAQSELDVISDRLAQQYPDSEEGWTVRVQLLSENFAGGERGRLGVLLMMAAVGFVMLIVCANVANLLLSRSAGRVKEIATRCAVGGSRGQIALQLLLESAVLGAIALPLGLIVGRGALDLFLSLVPSTITWMDTVFRFDAPVWIFAGIISAGTVLVFGLMPALQASRVDLQRALKEGGGRGSTAARPWVRQALAVVQLGLAISLLSTSALIIQSFTALQSRDPGLDPEPVLVSSVELPRQRYPTAAHWQDFQRELLRSVESLPGVESAATVNFPPFGYPGPIFPLDIEGRERMPNDEIPSALSMHVSPDYFATLGIEVLRGRAIGADDREGGVAVMVINDTLAQRYFGSEDPIGKRIEIAGVRREVVGVVGDYRNVGLRDPPLPQVFVPFAQSPSRTIGMVLRVSGQAPVRVVPAVRAALRGIDPILPLGPAAPLTQLIEDQIWTAKFFEHVMLILSGVALLLAALGVYAVISYSVSQRSQEFAIRAALGAEPRSMAELVLRQALLLIAGGTTVAAFASWTLRPVLERVLYTGQGWSTGQFIGIALFLGVIALLASAEPAIRATRSDPMTALRAE